MAVGSIAAFPFPAAFGSFGGATRLGAAAGALASSASAASANRIADDLRRRAQALGRRHDQLTAGLFDQLFSQLSSSTSRFGSALLKAQATSSSGGAGGRIAAVPLVGGLYVTRQSATRSGIVLSRLL